MISHLNLHSETPTWATRWRAESSALFCPIQSLPPRLKVLKTVSKHKRWRREGRISCPKLLLSTPSSRSTETRPDELCRREDWAQDGLCFISHDTNQRLCSSIRDTRLWVRQERIRSSRWIQTVMQSWTVRLDIPQQRCIQTWAGSCWRTDITWMKSLMMRIWTWFPLKPWAPPSAAALTVPPAACSDRTWRLPEVLMLCEWIKDTRLSSYSVFKSTDSFCLSSFKPRSLY